MPAPISARITASYWAAKAAKEQGSSAPTQGTLDATVCSGDEQQSGLQGPSSSITGESAGVGGGTTISHDAQMFAKIVRGAVSQLRWWR